MTAPPSTAARDSACLFGRASTTALVRVRNLGKSYGEQRILNDLSFDLAQGTMTAIVGINGVGKTTLLHVLSGSTTATTGSITIAGRDVATDPEASSCTALVQQSLVVDRSLRTQDYLVFRAGTRGMSPRAARSRIPRVAAELGISKLLSRRIAELSGGQARRVQLAAAILDQPQLVLLDEPTAGLDLASRRKYWHAVQHLVSTGSTVVAATHYFDELRYATDLIVLKDGSIARRGSPDEMIWQSSVGVVEILVDRREDAESIRSLLADQELEDLPDGIRVVTGQVPQVMERLSSAPELSIEIRTRPAQLDDVLMLDAAVDGDNE